MRSIRAWVRAFFGFSRTETNAFLILLPLIVAILFSEPLYRQWRTRLPRNFDERALDSLIARLQWAENDSVHAIKQISPGVNFSPFDPNSVSETDLVRMGLTSFLAGRITRYREKGGTFRKKEDLLKIYGFDSAWFEKARPWISIQQKEEIVKKDERMKRQVPLPEVYDINTADSLQLLNVYGIGPALSMRIRTFRDRLGGFVSLDQMREVYGLDSSVVQQINRKFRITETFIPKKINLNTVTLSEMMLHPYVRRKEAQAILSYRLQHGSFQSIDQLGEVKSLTPEWVKKMSPYLSLD